MAAFHLVVLLAWHARVAPALKRDAAVLHFNADLVAREAGEFGSDDKRIGRFTEVDRWCPALRPRGRQPLEAMLNREQVAERVPTCKCHIRIVALGRAGLVGSPGVARNAGPGFVRARTRCPR